MSAIPSTLLDEVIDAHGGLERWRSVRSITARVRSGGLLLRRFPGNRLADYEGRLDLHEPRAMLFPFPEPGRRAVFDHGEARIESDRGEVLASRTRPRPEFFGLSGLRRNLRWGPLDAAYFAGYAMWNYLTTPYLFTRDGVEVREGEPRREGGETWRSLEVSFPDDLDTHCREQAFYFDSRGLLRRHDYTAEVVGGWAKAAHFCEDHREFDGLVFPTRRHVHPRAPWGGSLPRPTMVWIGIDEIRAERGAARG